MELIKEHSNITSIENYPNYSSITDGALLTAPKIATAYNIPASTGAGVKIGIISLGGGFRQADLDRSMSDLGLTSPTITFVGVDGATNDYTGTGNDVENILDLVCVAGMVPEASIVFYKIDSDGSYYLPNPNDAAILNSTRKFAKVVNKAIDDNCDVISISWGNGDRILSNGVINYIGDYMSSILQKAASKGITICVASGDYGSSATGNGTIVSADYPSTNPYVIAVGGTYLTLKNDNTRLSETVYNNSEGNTGVGGSGGISSFIPAPVWQQGLTYRTYNRITGVTGPVTNLTTRGIPDISAAMNAYGLWLNGQILGIGGTSASAPIIAGMIARFIALSRRPYPLNGICYFYSTKVTNLFSDLTVGNNASKLTEGYVTSTSWDPVTGLGVPNGQILFNVLRYPPLGIVKNSSGSWAPIKDVKVKLASGWTQVKDVWVKTETGWQRPN